MRLAGALKKHATILGLAGSVATASSPASAQQPGPGGGLAPPPPMQRGGLAPPPPGSGPPAPAPMYPPYPNATQRHLEIAEQSDSGRGLEFVYFDVAGGGQFISLDAFSANHWLFPPMSAVDTSSFGAYVSAAAGIRLLFLTLGPSFRFGTFTDWDLWTLNLDLGWHVPLGNLEPYAFLGGGFAKLARHHEDFPGATNTSITGFNVRLGGGVDYYLSNVFSVGAKLDAELLRLSRGTALDQAGAAVAAEASTLGLVVSTGAVAGLHF